MAAFMLVKGGANTPPRGVSAFFEVTGKSQPWVASSYQAGCMGLRPKPRQKVHEAFRQALYST